MFKYLPLSERECPWCHSEIEFDISYSKYRFVGNQDEVYFCPRCHYGLLVIVRYKRVISKHLFIRNKLDTDED